MSIMFWKKFKKASQIALFCWVTIRFVSADDPVIRLLSAIDFKSLAVKMVDPVYQTVFSKTYVGSKINSNRYSLRHTPGSFSSDLKGIRHVAAYSWLHFVRDETPVDAVFLVFRIAEFAYYADRPFIRDIEPKMKPFYLTTSKDEAFSFLKNLGISYLQIPKYAIPMLYRSYIPDIIADPGLSTLVHETIGMQIYKLQREKTTYSSEPSDVFLPASQSEVGEKYFKVRGDTRASQVKFQMTSTNTASLDMVNDSDVSLAYDIAAKWNEDRSIICLNKTDFLPSFLRVSATARGKGLLSVTLEYSAPPRMKRRDSKYLWESVLYDDESRINFLINFPADSCIHNLVFRINGSSYLKLSDIKLEQLTLN